jgi:hypothetical protein
MPNLVSVCSQFLTPDMIARIASDRAYGGGRCKHWIKVKNPAPCVQ